MNNFICNTKKYGGNTMDRTELSKIIDAKHNPYEYTDFESIIQYFHKLQRGFQR